MKIECLLRRPGGTHVKIEETIYHFAPTKEDPRHVAEVSDKKHAQRFLSITEAYTFGDDADAPPATQKGGKNKQPTAPAGDTGGDAKTESKEGEGAQ